MIQSNENYISAVRNQYEQYPYPPRKKDQLTVSIANTLEIMNYHLYDGSRDFTEFRVLVAGCGTGDAVTFLGLQLQKNGGEVVGIDLSDASLKICQERVQLLELNNVILKRMSLLDLPKSDLGTFDYIDCIGVLHHLKCPLEGLKALKSVLKPHGGMNIMVYGKYGRTGIYHLQEALRIINKDITDAQTKVENAKKLLAKLPNTCWYKHGEKWIFDVEKYGDIGIYDLLLHSNDIPFSVDDVYQFAEDTGMNFVSFHKQYLYNPSSYIDPSLCHTLNTREKEALAEKVLGIIKKHCFYLSFDPVSHVITFDTIPFPVGNNLDLKKLATLIYEHLFSDTKMILVTLTLLSGDKINVPIECNPYLPRIIERIDNNKTLGEIFQEIQQELSDDIDLTTDKLMSIFESFFNNMICTDLLVTRRKDTPKYMFMDVVNSVL